MAASYLNCPFSRCIYDEPGGKQHFVKTLRDREIRRRYKAAAVSGNWRRCSASASAPFTEH